MNKIDLLCLFLRQNNFKKQEKLIKKLAEPAEPFLEWFEGSDRVYLDYSLDKDILEEEMRSDHKEIIKMIEYMGIDPSDASLVDGLSGIKSKAKSKSKINQFFFGKVLYEKISKDEYISKLNEEEFVNGKEFFFKKLLDIFLENSFEIEKDKFFKENIKNIESKYVYDAILKIEKYCEEISYAAKNYFSDSKRAVVDASKKVVITKNREDIINMSTGRNWTSCLARGQEYEEEVFCEVEDGGFAAYLIESWDEDITRPLSRIWIRRFDSGDGKSSIAVAENEVYGIEDEEFLKIVNDWIKLKQPNINPDIYHLKGSTYSDSFEEDMLFPGESLKFSMDFFQNPDSIFKIEDKVYLVKDNMSKIPIIKERMPGLVSLLKITDSPVLFDKKEDAENYIRFENKYSKRKIDDVVSIMGESRVEDTLESEHGEDWRDRFADIDGYLDFRHQNLEDLKEEKASLIEDSIVDEYGTNWKEESEAKDKYLSKMEDLEIFYEEELNELETKYNPNSVFYSFEKEVVSGINNESRFEVSELTKEEYYSNLKNNKAKMFALALKSILGMASRGDVSYSKEFMESIEGQIPEYTYNSIAFSQPDSSNQKKLKDEMNKLYLRFINQYNYMQRSMHESDLYPIGVSYRKTKNKELEKLIEDILESCLNKIIEDLQETDNMSDEMRVSLTRSFFALKEYFYPKYKLSGKLSELIMDNIDRLNKSDTTKINASRFKKRMALSSAENIEVINEALLYCSGVTVSFSYKSTDGKKETSSVHIDVISDLKNKKTEERVASYRLGRADLISLVSNNVGRVSEIDFLDKVLESMKIYVENIKKQYYEDLEMYKDSRRNLSKSLKAKNISRFKLCKDLIKIISG